MATEGNSTTKDVEEEVKKGGDAASPKDMANVDVFRTMTFPKLATLCDKFGNSFQFGNAGDYWHPAFPIGEDSDYRTHVRNIRDLEIREDDILIYSFPKTGLHWTAEIVGMLMRKSAVMMSESGGMGMLDMVPTSMIDKLPSPRPLVAHIPFRYMPKQAFEKKIKIIVLERNPKDVLVSYYCHMHAHSPPLGYPGTFEQFFRLYMDCGFYYGDVFDYLMERQAGLESYPDCKVLVSVFEDMKEDPVTCVMKINEYLGTGASKELCEEIVAACEFSKMKKYKDAKTPEGLKKIFKDNKPAFYRKGDVGDWVNWFTVAMSEEFDAEYKKRMSNYKLKYKYSL